MFKAHRYEIYCRNPKCNVREAILTVKNHGDQPDPKRWTCPGCGEPATVHWTRTAKEDERRRLELAIGAVNTALYERDHGPLIPASVMCLRELPESWKAVEPERDCSTTAAAAQPTQDAPKESK